MKTILSIFVFATMALLSSYLTFRFVGSGKTVQVPELRGKNLIEANRILSKEKLYLKIEAEQYSATIPEGHIISQNIPPGQQVKEGRTISVILSKGPKILSMPSFLGLDLDEARELARQKNLYIKKVIRTHSQAQEPNTVIAQRPSEYEKGSDSVTLVVSRGPYDTLYVCPDFTSMSLEQAKMLADRMGIEIELEGFGGTIVGQSPEPGSIVKTGDSITLRLQYTEEQQLRWL